MKPQSGTPQSYDGFCQACGNWIETTSHQSNQPQLQPKVCYTCKHLTTNEDPDQWRFGGSDVTPSGSFKIFCKLDHWSYYEGPIVDLREGLLKAHDCVDYSNLVQLPSEQQLNQQPIEDYVGHVHRPPFCSSCHSNIVVQAGVLGKYPDNNEITQYVSFCPTCHPTLKVHPTLQGVAYYVS